MVSARVFPQVGSAEGGVVLAEPVVLGEQGCLAGARVGACACGSGGSGGGGGGGGSGGSGDGGR